ncbi:hypothetical protein [Microvirga terricola]|uniref:Uncharacterized protein n=1 Tax=Microvirga terricola TaxID=2719797 RepID=A0ABX0V7B1_9HYPH|nr:hypothetical protein [Microvirga terricola]NIX75468.1 hypothetical protein [Microvirga terricola]
MTSVAVLDPPVRLSPNSEALLASLMGRFVRFNVPDGRVFLNSLFDAQGVIIEHFPERERPWQQQFLYLCGIVGREKQRRSWAIREIRILSRLPIGLFKNCYEWRPKLKGYVRKGGTAIVTFSGGFRRLAKIEIFSELVSFDDGEEEVERVFAEADRRICFTYDNGESIAFETDDSGNQPLLITDGEIRPLDRSLNTLKSRLVLTEVSAAHGTSAGH